MAWSKRIVVAFDGSPPAQQALARAAELGRPGDTVGLVHVGQDGSGGSRGRAVSLPGV